MNDSPKDGPKDGREPRRHRGIYLLPNLFTTGALFAGFYSIVAAMGGRFEAAAVAIFVAMIMDAVVDRYFPILDALETDLERIEDRIFANQTSRANIEDLYELKRKLTLLKHAAEPLLEATGKLFGGRVPQICAGLQDYFRDVFDHLYRLNQSIDSLRDMLTTAISVNLSLITFQESEVTKRLASYAALVAVPTLIAGVYGMNFHHMPELTSPYGYPATLAVMAGIDGYLFYRFRKAKWL